jgi:chorismate dehydratase
MKTTRICAVSYYNTLPFIYGIQSSGLMHNYTLDIQVPSVCAQKLMNGEADISLVPAGALPALNDYRFVSDLCIGATRHVKSVLLLANEEVSNLKTIYLDTDSLTSVNLVRILAKYHWNINPIWKSLPEMKERLLTGEGMVLIGDKTFGVCNRFYYCYDLASEWNNFTQLPFVFALWVAKTEISARFEKDFRHSLIWGVQNRKESVTLAENLHITVNELISYLENDISYKFDEDKKKGLALYLELLKQI